MVFDLQLFALNGGHGSGHDVSGERGPYPTQSTLPSLFLHILSI